MLKISSYIVDEKFIHRKYFGESRGMSILLTSQLSSNPTNDDGIVILDDDYGTIILDKHFSHMTSKEKNNEFDRICSMDWREFCHFVVTNPNRRGVPIDIMVGNFPSKGNLKMQKLFGRQISFETGSDIRRKIMKEINEDPSSMKFPEENRSEIEFFILSHKMSQNGYGDLMISWCVENMEDFPDEPSNDGFDLLWNKVKEDNSLLDDARDMALSYYLNGHYSTLHGKDSGDYDFESTNSKEINLVLKKVKGKKISFGSLRECAETLSRLPQKDLLDLYFLIKNIDFDMNNFSTEIKKQYEKLKEDYKNSWKNDVNLFIEEMFGYDLSFEEIINSILHSNIRIDDFLRTVHYMNFLNGDQIEQLKLLSDSETLETTTFKI